MTKRKQKNKVEPNKSNFMKQSRKLEAEIGDDSEAYNLSEDELEELLEDDELLVPEIIDDDWFDDDMPGDDAANMDEFDPDAPFIYWPFDDEWVD